MTAPPQTLRSRLFGLARGVAIIGALVWIMVFAGLWTFQDQLLFPAPSVPQAQLDAAVAAGGGRIARIPSEGGVSLYGWVFDPPVPDGGCAVIYFHGNGEPLLGLDRLAANIREGGCTVVGFAWRGYPGSSGEPSEAGLRADAQAIVDFVVAPVADGGLGFAISHVVLFGNSLGTGLAVDQASKRPVGALVLNAPYTSLAEAAASHYPWLPVQTFIRHPLPSLDRAPLVKAPALVAHGDADTVVPVEQGRRMAEALRAAYVEVPGGAHSGLHVLVNPRARERFFGLLSSVRASGGAAPQPRR